MNNIQQVVDLLDDILTEFGHKEQIVLSTDRIIELKEKLGCPHCGDNSKLDMYEDMNGEWVNICFKCYRSF